MTGRELKRHNDLFYLCALIEYIARATKNRNRVIVNALGEERLTKIYKLADIYHSDNIARVADDLVKECNIENDYFDITDVKYAVPHPLGHSQSIQTPHRKRFPGQSKTVHQDLDYCIQLLDCRQNRRLQQ